MAITDDGTATVAPAMSNNAIAKVTGINTITETLDKTTFYQRYRQFWLYLCWFELLIYCISNKHHPYWGPNYTHCDTDCDTDCDGRALSESHS